MTPIHHIRPTDSDYSTRLVAPLRLINLIWPLPEPRDIEKWRLRGTHHFVIYSEAEPLAHAGIFVREVFTARGTIPVGALGGVCVHPDYRGRGWGRDVAQAAFDFLPQLGVEVSLFQTPVPDFYARLGARLVSNRFHNGSNPADPFMDVYKMILPASFDWPEGDIDINGPGY